MKLLIDTTSFFDSLVRLNDIHIVVVLDLRIYAHFRCTFKRLVALELHLVELVDCLAVDGMYLRVQCQEFHRE